MPTLRPIAVAVLLACSLNLPSASAAWAGVDQFMSATYSVPEGGFVDVNARFYPRGDENGVDPYLQICVTVDNTAAGYDVGCHVLQVPPTLSGAIAYMEPALLSFGRIHGAIPVSAGQIVFDVTFAGTGELTPNYSVDPANPYVETYRPATAVMDVVAPSGTFLGVTTEYASLYQRVGATP